MLAMYSVCTPRHEMATNQDGIVEYVSICCRKTLCTAAAASPPFGEKVTNPGDSSLLTHFLQCCIFKFENASAELSKPPCSPSLISMTEVRPHPLDSWTRNTLKVQEVCPTEESLTSKFIRKISRLAEITGCESARI